LVRVVDQGRVLLVVKKVVKHILLVTVYLISVQTVVMEVALAVRCAAATGLLFAMFAVMVLVLCIMVLVAVHMATLVLVKSGVIQISAGTSNLFLIQVV
jgi:hypothetical protein